MLFWGMVCAILSCITGYALSTSGDYDLTLVSWHKWMGISVAIVSLGLYILFRVVKSQFALRIISVILLVLITITGHLGGSLTHGADYLSFAKAAKKAIVKPIPNVQQAIAYNDLIQPLLQNKCYSCHGPEKQKGKLRLDLQDLILKGGKDGVVLVPGDADKSNLIKRIMLSPGNDEHMPPKEKPQLTDNEIALIHWWIDNGADFKKKVNQIKQPEDIKPVLASFQSGAAHTEAKISDVPAAAVKPADNEIVKKLTLAGVVVLPVATNSNYLSVNFVNDPSVSDTAMRELSKIGKQVVWLKMDNSTVTDSAVKYIGSLGQLTRLHLNNTKITDKGLAGLKKLTRLQSLSLVGTQVTAKGLLQLKGLKNISSIYLYKSNVLKTDWPQLKKAFPKAYLDSGNYAVPTLATDTTEVKAPEKKAM